MKTLAQRIKAWREGANLTQEELARALMISVASLQKYERGARTPHPDLLERIEAKIGAA